MMARALAHGRKRTCTCARAKRCRTTYRHATTLHLPNLTSTAFDSPMLAAVLMMSSSPIPYFARPYSWPQLEATVAMRGLILCDAEAWHGRTEADRPLPTHAASAGPKTAARAVDTVAEVELCSPRGHAQL